MNRVDAGLFLTAMLTAAELSAACTSGNTPAKTATPTSMVRSYEPDSLPSIELMAIASRIDPLIVANSEQQVWENSVKIAPIIYEAYCKAFPGCIKPDPKVEFLSLREFSNKLQSDDPTRYRYPDDEVRSFYATTLSDRVIIVNKDHLRVRSSIQQRLFSNVVSNLPAILLEYQFYADREQRKKISFSITQKGIEYTFDQVYGFGIENSKTGLKFTDIQQAAAVLASQEVQRRMGLVLTASSKEGEAMAQYLQRRIVGANISINALVELHRNSDLDTLLVQLYPGTTTQNQRMLTAMTEFTIIRGSAQ